MCAPVTRVALSGLGPLSLRGEAGDYICFFFHPMGNVPIGHLHLRYTNAIGRGIGAFSGVSGSQGPPR